MHDTFHYTWSWIVFDVCRPAMHPAPHPKPHAGSCPKLGSSLPCPSQGAILSPALLVPGTRLTSVYKGVSWSGPEDNRWLAVAWDRAARVPRTIGSFATEEEVRYGFLLQHCPAF